MIPVNEKETIPWKDEVSEVSFDILPSVGPNEYEAQKIIRQNFGNIPENSEKSAIMLNMETTDQIFNLFVKGWSHPTKTLLPFPSDGNPAKCFSSEYKGKVVYQVILKDFNKLDTEEKKSSSQQ